MSDHDPLCPLHRVVWDKDDPCECILIAKVRADQDEKSRADEGEQIAQAIENDRDAVGTKDSAWDNGWCHGMESAARIARNRRSLMADQIWRCPQCGRTYPEYVNGCPEGHDPPVSVDLVVESSRPDRPERGS